MPPKRKSSNSKTRVKKVEERKVSKTVVSDHATIVSPNVTVIGNHNNICGKGCHVKGSYNIISGEGSTFEGNYNQLFAENITGTGNYTGIYRKGCRVLGNFKSGPGAAFPLDDGPPEVYKKMPVGNPVSDLEELSSRNPFQIATGGSIVAGRIRAGNTSVVNSFGTFDTTTRLCPVESDAMFGTLTFYCAGKLISVVGIPGKSVKQQDGWTTIGGRIVFTPNGVFFDGEFVSGISERIQDEERLNISYADLLGQCTVSSVSKHIVHDLTQETWTVSSGSASSSSSCRNITGKRPRSPSTEERSFKKQKECQILRPEDDSPVADGEKSCNVCMENVPAVVFHPCRHGRVCITCALKLRSKGEARCPICRKDIEKMERFYG